MIIKNLEEFSDIETILDTLKCLIQTIIQTKENVEISSEFGNAIGNAFKILLNDIPSLSVLAILLNTLIKKTKSEEFSKLDGMVLL